MRSKELPLRRKLPRILCGGFLVATTVACEKKADDISSAERTKAIEAIHDSLTRTVDFWNTRYQEFGVDRDTVPDLHINYDDDEGSKMCDIATKSEEGEIFFCNIDGAMTINPKAVLALVRNLGLDPNNQTHLLAVTDIIAGHEFGHFLQLLNGTDSNSTTRELQADCLAGAQLAVTGFGQEISENKVAESYYLYSSIMYALGNAPTHGTGDQRVANFDEGYEYGIEACL